LPGQDAAASLIRWWRDAGVDVLVDDAPRGWLRNPLSASGERDGREAARGRASVSDLPSPGLAPFAHPLPVRERADLPPTLPDLLAWLRDSADAPEARWGRKRLLPTGDPSSDLMILIDMPEPGDAEAGRLLSGEVGELFDNMLKAIGRSRETIWLAPFATVRKIGRFSQAEQARLAEIARHAIGLVAPKRLLIMGEAPAEALIGRGWTAARTGFHILNLGSVQVETVTTYTPGSLNKNTSLKKDAWRTLQLLVKGLS
jgi:uracil-DNA glycosylase